MKILVHITADFPDPLVPGKTKAVPSLIESASNFHNIVYSLNRVSWRAGIAARPFGDGHLAIAYGAPPYGLRLSHHLSQLADFVLEDLAKRGIVPDLIHAHKFTVDGLVAHRLSQSIGCPFVASIWGDTDRRVFEAKPNLKSAFRAIARDAVMLLPAAPWTRDYFADALEIDRRKFRLLPVITKADALLPPVFCEMPRLLSVFAFDSWKRKGFHRLVRAVAAVSKELPELRLDVFGRGGPRSLIDMTRQISEAGVADRVRLMNALDHREVQSVMNGYAAFVLPSRPETFGMVYVEAVLASVPILWSQGEGVDGFFTDMDIGYRCNPQSTDDIAEGLCYLISEQRHLKERIGFFQDQGAFDVLRREAIGAHYRELIALAMGERAQAAASAA